MDFRRGIRMGILKTGRALFEKCSNTRSIKKTLRSVSLPLLLLLAPQLLLASSSRPKIEHCETALIMTIRARQGSETRRLLNAGVDLNEKACPEGNTALLEALGSQPEIAKLLIAAGADPN